jgi:hypothetical protein
MKKLYIIFLGLAGSITTMAQTPEDALRLSWNPTFGTARNMAIGGTMVGLGGEITAAHSNPAGLGFYKNGEIVLSPGFSFGKNKIDYRNVAGQTGDKVNNFNLGTSGIILAGGFENSSIKSAALSFTVNRVADFNNNQYYKGFNNKSKGAERYAEEFSQAKLNFDDALNSKYISLPTRMAIWTYLIDTLTIGGQPQVIALPEFTDVNQENSIISSGGINEYALSLGVNKNEKLFWGASVGASIVNLKRDVKYTESDATTNTTNRFGTYTYDESLTSRGVGFNAKIGVIYRPVERVRFGLTIHTPTIHSFTDRLTGNMVTNSENYLPTNPIRTATTKDITGGEDVIESKYSFNSPWKIAGGASYVFRETENVKKQRAFIAADIEYITYKSMNFNATSESQDQQGSKKFYDATNSNIKAIYKNAFNFKVGGEVKFNTIMVRLGGAYFGNPNKEADVLKNNRVHLSGGLGYRHKGIFIDATYVHMMGKEVNFPYRLGDKPNTFANVKNTTGTVMFTVGTKF